MERLYSTVCSANEQICSAVIRRNLSPSASRPAARERRRSGDRLMGVSRACVHKRIRSENVHSGRLTLGKVYSARAQCSSLCAAGDQV